MLDWHDVSAGAQPVEVIRPSLHHLASFVETLCTIVGSTNLIALRMSEFSGTLWNGELVRADGIEPPTFAL